MPKRLGLWFLRRIYRQDYETLFHVVILSKHHHYHISEGEDVEYDVVSDPNKGGKLSASNVTGPDGSPVIGT
jgi:cold shock CspA family protein